jgi:ADP-ribosylglycohydrolase
VSPSLDQFSGCLLGLALGDALGAPVEAAAPAEARAHAQRLRSGTLGDDAGFGQVTDDTQLARALLTSILASDGFDPAHFAATLRAEVEGPGVIGAGPATLGVARALSRGVPWHLAGLPAPYAGNGAAMRVAPLGLLFSHDDERLTRMVVGQSRVTHHDPRAVAAALVVAGAVALAARPGRLEPAAALDALSRLVGSIEPVVADAVAGLTEWIALSPERASRRVHELGLEPEPREGWRGISAYAVSSVCWSLYAAFRSPEDYVEAVAVAIEVGGDTDSMAAMAGAIVGARVGATGLPSSSMKRVHDRGLWDWAELARLAGRAHAWAGRY